MTKIKTAIMKYGAIPVSTGLMVLVPAIPAFASESSSSVGPDAWKPVIDAMAAQLNVTTVIAVLASLVTAGIGLVFMWWGVRKAVSSLMAAFRNGKLSLGGGRRR